MKQDKILIIEDDNDLANLIKDYLSIENIEGEIASDGLIGLELAANNKYSLILLDIMLPGIDGISICKKIREVSTIPIIMLSAKSEEMDKILCLGVGADDYITKPFSPMELLARIKANIRRGNLCINENNNDANVIDYGRLKIYSKKYKITIDDTEVDITTKEFQLLSYLCKNEGQVFTKEQLYNAVWGCDSEFMDENTIAVYIKRLRNKLSDIGKKSIKTVWGVGYKFEYAD